MSSGRFISAWVAEMRGGGEQGGGRRGEDSGRGVQGVKTDGGRRRRGAEGSGGVGGGEMRGGRGREGRGGRDLLRGRALLKAQGPRAFTSRQELIHPILGKPWCPRAIPDHKTGCDWNSGLVH